MEEASFLTKYGSKVTQVVWSVVSMEVAAQPSSLQPIVLSEAESPATSYNRSSGIHLRCCGCLQVYIIHRRDEFRASKIMQNRALANPKIEVLCSAQSISCEMDHVMWR